MWRCGGPAGDTRHVPHPPVGRVAGQTRAPNPVAAVLVQTGQTLPPSLSCPPQTASKTFHYELYKISSLGQSAVVELEGVGVGQGDGEH